MGNRKENIDDKVKRLREAVKAAIAVKIDAEQPDVYTQKEADDYERQEKFVRIESLRQDIKERKRFATLIFGLISVWLLFVIGLLIANGIFSTLNRNFLSDKVIIAILVETTLKVLVLFYWVVLYLFPQNR